MLRWRHRAAPATSHSPPCQGEEPQLGGKQRGQSLNEKEEAETEAQAGERFPKATQLSLETRLVVQCPPHPTWLPNWVVLGWAPPTPGL